MYHFKRLQVPIAKGLLPTNAANSQQSPNMTKHTGRYNRARIQFYVGRVPIAFVQLNDALKKKWASVSECPYPNSRPLCRQPIKMLLHTFATYGFGNSCRQGTTRFPCPRTFHSYPYTTSAGLSGMYVTTAVTELSPMCHARRGFPYFVGRLVNLYAVTCRQPQWFNSPYLQMYEIISNTPIPRLRNLRIYTNSKLKTGRKLNLCEPRPETHPVFGRAVVRYGNTYSSLKRKSQLSSSRNMFARVHNISWSYTCASISVRRDTFSPSTEYLSM